MYQFLLKFLFQSLIWVSDLKKNITHLLPHQFHSHSHLPVTPTLWPSSKKPISPITTFHTASLPQQTHSENFKPLNFHQPHSSFGHLTPSDSDLHCHSLSNPNPLFRPKPAPVDQNNPFFITKIPADISQHPKSKYPPLSAYHFYFFSLIYFAFSAKKSWKKMTTTTHRNFNLR